MIDMQATPAGWDDKSWQDVQETSRQLARLIVQLHALQLSGPEENAVAIAGHFETIARVAQAGEAAARWACPALDD